MEFPTITLDELVAKLHEHNLDSNDLVQKAHSKAKEYFKHDRRRNGAPVLEGHLYPVTMYIIEHQEFTHQKVTPEVVAGALTHDLIEDKINDDLFINVFGDVLYKIVKPLTKPSRFYVGGTEQERKEWKHACNTEDFSRLEEAPQESNLIKLADRLHNMCCIDKPKRVEQYLWEAEEFYLPFALRHSTYFYLRIKQRVEELKVMNS